MRQVPPEFLAVTLPLMVTILVAVFGAVWNNNRHIDRGFDQINRRMDDMGKSLEDIRATLRSINTTLTSPEGRISKLEERSSPWHKN